MIETPEITYLILIFTLLVVPHFFHRFKIPSPIITFILGIIVAASEIMRLDSTISLMATIGISALFLFAGMEVDFFSVKKEMKVLIKHMIFELLLLSGVAYAMHQIFQIPWRVAIIVSLALLTPSTGFILESLQSLYLKEVEEFWVKAIAITTEIAALLIMFAALQSDTVTNLTVSLLALLGIIIVLPLLFWFFAKTVIPYAPHADFAFYILLALVCGFMTKSLGTYYLVGAFIVGVVARRFENHFTSRETEETLQALRLFSTFFIPFYFFKAGLTTDVFSFTWSAFFLSLIFLAVLVPLRMLILVGHGKFFLKTTYKEAFPVALALLPNLVFGLVLADILHQRYDISSTIIHAIIIYTLFISLIPRFFIKTKAPVITELQPDLPIN